jgi:hypothetical protein
MMSKKARRREMEFFTAPANLMFSVALAVVVGLAILEVASLLVGGGGLDLDSDADTDADLDVDAGLPAQILGWLHFGQMPLTVWLIVFLLGFGASGLLLQMLLQNTLGGMLPSPLSLLPPFVIAILATRLFGGVLKKILPRDESEAVTRESLLGQSGVITVGTAQSGRPAEARVRDPFGQHHYVMVEPDNDGETFAAGSRVVLLKQRDDVYRVIGDAPGVEDVQASETVESRRLRA